MRLRTLGYPFATILASTFALSACSGSAPAKAPAAATKNAKLAPATDKDGDDPGAAGATSKSTAELFAREHAPMKKQAVSLFEGRITGKIEAAAPITPECTMDEKRWYCSFSVPMGQDAAGDEYSVECDATAGTTPFSEAVKSVQGQDSTLTTPPVLWVQTRGDALRVQFTANLAARDDENTVGTLKLAAYYADGYTLMCHDRRAGAMKTFPRVVNGFWDSLVRTPTSTPVAVQRYLLREGDTPVGFREKYAQRTDDGGIEETYLSFRMRTDGKTWSVWDHGQYWERDADGKVLEVTHTWWQDGAKSLTMNAKATEAGRYRVKSTVGEASNAIELTPKAPLGTEWSSALKFRELGAAKKEFRYADPKLDESQDPSFNYIVLRPAKTGLLKETEEPHVAPRGNKRTPSADDLFIDERGVVKKEVAEDHVAELIFERGTYPELRAKKSHPKNNKK